MNARPYQVASPIDAPTVPLGGGLVAPPPSAAVIERRIVEIAEAYGVVAAPRLISAKVTANEDTNSVVSLDILADGTEGPLFVVGLDFSETMHQARCVLQSGARRLVEGRTMRVVDAFVTPLEETRSLHAPIVILRDDVLSIGLDLSENGTTFSETDRVIARCLVLRSRDGSRLAGVADEIAAFIMGEGEWYAAACQFSPDTSVNGDQSEQNVNDDVIVQATIVAAPQSVVEGTVSASSVKAHIGNYDVSPGIGGVLTGTVSAVDQGEAVNVYQPHLRYPVRRGQRIGIRAEYPTGTAVPCRFVVLGRRLISGALVNL